MSIPVKILMFFERMIPLFIKRIFARMMSGLAYRLLHKHKLIAVHNLTRSFPEKSLDEILKIIRESYASFSMIFAEFMAVYRTDRKHLEDWVSVKGLEHYEQACSEGKGVLLITAHFGNWEVGNVALALLSNPPIFMARKLDSPLLEALTTAVRTKLGIGQLNKETAKRSTINLLRKGKAIELLIDQNVAAREGVFVDFFGRPACATSGIALMALHTGAAVLPIFTSRMTDGRYLTEIGPRIETVRTGDRDQDVLINTQNYHSVIENHVRKYPEQWLWLHQRWKTKRCQMRKKG